MSAPSERMIQRVEAACRELKAEGLWGWSSGDLAYRKGNRHQFGITTCIGALKVLVERGVLTVRGRSCNTYYAPGAGWTPPGTEPKS